jgi:hypothetical protein
MRPPGKKEQPKRTDKMRRVFTLIAAGAAFAAGPVLAQSVDWTGAYVGGELGFANADTNTAGHDKSFSGGLIAGYDFDLGNWVIGGGIDHDFTNVDLGGGVDLERLFRLKLRGGYKIGKGLVYATGGFARADTNILGDDQGYFIGAGYEHRVSQKFSIGGEVLYHEFNNYNGTATDVEATTLQVRGIFRF